MNSRVSSAPWFRHSFVFAYHKDKDGRRRNGSSNASESSAGVFRAMLAKGAGIGNGIGKPGAVVLGFETDLPGGVS